LTEIDWLTGADPQAMLAHLEGKVSARKLRLFACACVRRGWSRLRYGAPRRAVETAERFAEGDAGAGDLEQARETAEQTVPSEFDYFAYLAAAACAAEDPLEAARNTCESMRRQAVREAAHEAIPGENEQQVNAAASAAECRAQADLLREVFGNPFRPAALQPGWVACGGAAASIARVIDDGGGFEDFPYLADALLDAGCTDERLLAHCRQPAGHVRGCWALDLLLGRE
jgi:hypothetical protein